MNLGLKCPYCQEPVFWRSGSEYRRRGTPVLRSASFCHHKGTGEECEAKSITKGGQDELKALQRKARGQRLSLFNQEFSGLVYGAVSSFKTVNAVKKQIKKLDMEIYRRYGDYVPLMHQHLQKDLSTVVDKSFQAYEYQKEVWGEIAEKDVVWCSPFQKQMIEESLSFLSTNKGKKAFTDLAWLALYRVLEQVAGALSHQDPKTFLMMDSLRSFKSVGSNHSSMKFLQSLPFDEDVRERTLDKERLVEGICFLLVAISWGDVLKGKGEGSTVVEA